MKYFETEIILRFYKNINVIIMRRSCKILVFVVSLFFIFACGNRRMNNVVMDSLNVEVSLSPQSVLLSEIADFSTLALPTSDSLLIGRIDKIHSNSEFIVVSDVSSLYKFTYDGTFVGRISKRGAGPDEYLSIDDFLMDKDGNALILSRNMKSLLLYSWDGKLLKKINLGLWGMNICLLDNHVLLYTGNEATPSGTQLHLLDFSTEEIIKSYKPLDEEKAKYLHVRSNNMFRVNADNSCIFTELFNDSIYRITPDSYSIEFAFDWDGHNVPTSFYERNYANIMEFFQSFNRIGTYAYGINLYTESSDSHWVSYFYKQNCFLAIVPKDGGNELICNKLILDTSFGQYPIELINVEMFLQDSGRIVIPLDVYSIKEYLSSSSSKDIIGRDWNTIADDSNPYLLIISPKK